jgi:tetratricopeptide (TPR) repeat protein
MKSPFKFLDSYDSSDNEIFFGRKEETDQLYELVFKSPLVLIYGLSGTGKTSLVQCGLSSRFDGPDWYPFFIRRKDNLIESIDTTLRAVFPEDEDWNEEDMRHNINALFEEYLRPIYLIFDQLEELFILGSKEEQLQFAELIGTLIATPLPCRILLIIREEFLGRLYQMEKTLPMIYDFKLRVEPMGFKKVGEVIKGTLNAFNVSLDHPDQNVELMYDKLSAGKSGIQLPYLQIYLDSLYRKELGSIYPDKKNSDSTTQENWPSLTIHTEEIEELGNIEEVLAGFMEGQKKRIQDEVQQVFPQTDPNTTGNLLDLFVTEEGTKRPVYFERKEELIILEEKTLSWLPDIPTQVITFVLNKLINTRLLSIKEGYLEFSHDTLAYLIDRERGEYQRKLSLYYTRIVNAYKTFPISGEYLSRVQLNLMNEHLPELEKRLDEELWKFVQDSEHEAYEKEQKELRRERRRRRIAMIFAMVGFTLAGLALIGFTLSSINAKKAREQAIEAHINYGQALKTEWRFDEAYDQLLMALNIADSPKENIRINGFLNTWSKIDSLVELSVIMVKQDSLLKAKQSIDLAYQLSPDTTLQMRSSTLQNKIDSAVTFHLLGGESNLRVNQNRAAIERFKKVLQFDPNNKKAIDWLEKLQD